jgi:hypothetical protein
MHPIHSTIAPSFLGCSVPRIGFIPYETEHLVSMEILEKLGRPALVSCEHCGQPRAKLHMRELRHACYGNPSPLFVRLVSQLRRIYGADATIFICSACSCVTGDLTRHSH